MVNVCSAFRVLLVRLQQHNTSEIVILCILNFITGGMRKVKVSKLNNIKQLPSLVCFSVIRSDSETNHKLHAYFSDY